MVGSLTQHSSRRPQQLQWDGCVSVAITPTTASPLQQLAMLWAPSYSRCLPTSSMYSTHTLLLALVILSSLSSVNTILFQNKGMISVCISGLCFWFPVLMLMFHKLKFIKRSAEQAAICIELFSFLQFPLIPCISGTLRQLGSTACVLRGSDALHRVHHPSNMGDKHCCARPSPFLAGTSL